MTLSALISRFKQAHLTLEIHWSNLPAISLKDFPRSWNQKVSCFPLRPTSDDTSVVIQIWNSLTIRDDESSIKQFPGIRQDALKKYDSFLIQITVFLCSVLLIEKLLCKCKSVWEQYLRPSSGLGRETDWMAKCISSFTPKDHVLHSFSTPHPHSKDNASHLFSLSLRHWLKHN